MKKRMLIMLIGLSILFGGIFAYQLFKAYMMKKYLSQGSSPVVSVSTMKVKTLPWQPHINASGSVRAVKGVDVTTEIAGLVRQIYFTPGAQVNKDDPLIKLNDDTEVAQLNSLLANLEIAKITFERDKAQYAINAVSKQVLDNDAATVRSTQAQVEEQKAVIAKKNIRAPFAGRLGISKVNPGQYLNPGDNVVTLQSLDPIYVDFYLPQQELVDISVGQKVIVKSDSFVGKTFTGKITTISPKIDPATRNIEVEATLSNPTHALLPGMFVTVTIDRGNVKQYLTVPQTAISYNPYGEIAYIINQSGKDENGNPILKATQTFVTVGDTRGDQVAVLKGLKEGQEVVIGGQLKLKNGSQVSINNAILPQNNPAPKPKDE